MTASDKEVDALPLESDASTQCGFHQEFVEGKIYENIIMFTILITNNRLQFSN